MRPISRIWKDQQGVTLTELLIAIAILGGISLITAKLMDDQSSQQNHLKTMASISQTMTRIESHLNNSDHCRQMLVGKTIGNTLGVSGTVDAQLFTITSGGNSLTVLKEGKHDLYNIPDNGVSLMNSVYGSTVADVVINFQPTKATAFAKARGTITQRLPIVVVTNASNVVTSCGPVLLDSNLTAQKQMCESLAAFTFWDSVLGRCMLNSIKCPWGQVMTKMNNLGSVVCEDLQGQVKLEDMFDFNGVDCSAKNPLDIRIINNGGKFKVTCF